MAETLYRCSNSKCKAEDRDHGVGNIAPPLALNCYKCGAGRKLEIGDMLASRRGMFPVVGEALN